MFMSHICRCCYSKYKYFKYIDIIVISYIKLQKPAFHFYSLSANFQISNSENN